MPPTTRPTAPRSGSSPRNRKLDPRAITASQRSRALGFAARADLRAPIDVVALAERFAITGAEVRDAAVDAAYLAAAGDGVVTQDLLVTAIRRQYEKAGRSAPP